MTQPLNRMHQNENNRHKNRPCKWALKLRLHTVIKWADFGSVIRTTVKECIREKMTLCFRG